MKSPLNIFLLSVLFFSGFFSKTNAQILQTRDQVISEYGEPFCSGTAENGDSYLFYKIPVTTANSGSYEQRKVLFFKTFGDGTETCYKWKIIEPSSETAHNIASFTRNLVQTGDTEWKDYGKGILYSIRQGKGVCKITATFDNSPAMVKVYKVN